jgi:hypothetical protein
MGKMNRAENILAFRRANMHGTLTGPNADPDYQEKYHPGSGGQKSLPIEERIRKALEEANKFDQQYSHSMILAWDEHHNLTNLDGYTSAIEATALVNTDIDNFDIEEPMRIGLDLADKWDIPVVASVHAFDGYDADDYYPGQGLPTTEQLVRFYKAFGFEDMPEPAQDEMRMYRPALVYYPGNTGPKR